MTTKLAHPQKVVGKTDFERRGVNRCGELVGDVGAGLTTGVEVGAVGVALGMLCGAVGVGGFAPVDAETPPIEAGQFRPFLQFGQ